ncbi:hypothetical protein GY45DRAFT_1328343 [Cubamyces sp. BRFM 1775]|nr:hypothetical protein GY45DRAFT_1328343 [Cubamyces sp. BRFM 1775]
MYNATTGRSQGRPLELLRGSAFGLVTSLVLISCFARRPKPATMKGTDGQVTHDKPPSHLRSVVFAGGIATWSNNPHGCLP